MTNCRIINRAAYVVLALIIRDNQLAEYLVPVSISLSPFPRYILTGQIQYFLQRTVTWKFQLLFQLSSSYPYAPHLDLSVPML